MDVSGTAAVPFGYLISIFCDDISILLSASVIVADIFIVSYGFMILSFVITSAITGFLFVRKYRMSVVLMFPAISAHLKTMLCGPSVIGFLKNA